MTRVAIIAALSDELKPLVRGWRSESRNGVELWRRDRGDGEWIAACSGVGTQAAARALAEIEKDGAVGQLLSVGWAGALNNRFAAGRAYRVSGVVDARTGERFRAGARSAGCWLATSETVAGQPEKRRLAATYGADLVDMEAAELARLAGMRGIPFQCIKGVSDGVGDQLPDFNPFFAANGQFRRMRFIRFALLRPWRWPALARLGARSRMAAHAIAESVLELLNEGETGGKG